ncbi:unnamed protein product [Cuscuta campestris]|uniref:Reverse transcriptase Ty1/copia-type domain-containing protein n=1 Tax=Cuscuta campestris TaxID=132261 RepID=A0A484NC75_9ASTE|nr:unnamed protein product [Cuscuta campestris]
MAKNSEVTSQNNSSEPPHLAFTTISNVKLHVPVSLSLSQPNYKKWSRLFLLLVRRFNLKGYIDGFVVLLSDDDDEWFKLDALLQGWILSTITDEVSDLVISSVSTASALWKVIHDLFHDNKHARAMQLKHEFRTTYPNTNSSFKCFVVSLPISRHKHHSCNFRIPCPRFCRFDPPSCCSIDNGRVPPTRGPRRFSRPEPAATPTAALPAAMADIMAAQALGKATPGNMEAMNEDKAVAVELGAEVADVKTAHDRGNPTTATMPATHRLLQSLIQKLKAEFAMTDMGDLHFFLGINVHRTAQSLFLHQTQFTHDIPERAGMVSCRPISTPVDTKDKLSSSSGTALPDPSLYRSIVGALQYLTFTRPDITYAVQQLCLHLHAPRDSHLTAMKRVLCYLSGTATHFLLKRKRREVDD